VKTFGHQGVACVCLVSAGPREQTQQQGEAHEGREIDVDLDEFVGQCKEAWQAFVAGDPGPSTLLFSHRDDVTLANPWGPAVRGWADVSGTLEATAARFRDGRLTAFDILSRFVADDLACHHEIERGEAKLGGRPQHEPFTLRVTTIYRLEDAQWRIVLRHADPIVAPRAAGATLGGQKASA